MYFINISYKVNCYLLCHVLLLTDLIDGVVVRVVKCISVSGLGSASGHLHLCLLLIQNSLPKTMTSMLLWWVATKTLRWKMMTLSLGIQTNYCYSCDRRKVGKLQNCKCLQTPYLPAGCWSWQCTLDPWPPGRLWRTSGCGRELWCPQGRQHQ